METESTSQDLFLPGEIERGCAFEARTVEMLKREGYAPKPISKAGRGRVAKYDFEGLCRFATIACVFGVTGKIIPAARMANTISSELVRSRGKFPAGLDDIGRNLNNRLVFRNANGEMNWVELFRQAIREGEQRLDYPISNDFRLLIADGEYVFQLPAKPLSFTPNFEGDDGDASPLFRLVFNGRGVAHRIEHVELDSVSPEFYSVKLKNAVSKVELNLSLNIRKILLGILEARSE